MTALDFISLSLAVLRIAYMVTAEDGPFYLFSRWRGYLTRLEVERKQPAWWIDGWFCVLCCSWWIGIVYGVVFLFKPKVGRIISLPFSLSALTLLYKRLLP